MDAYTAFHPQRFPGPDRRFRTQGGQSQISLSKLRSLTLCLVALCGLGQGCAGSDESAKPAVHDEQDAAGVAQPERDVGGDAPEPASSGGSSVPAADGGRDNDATFACGAPSAEQSERLLRGQFAPPSDAPTVAAGTIAYLRYDDSIQSRTEIRLIAEDGSDDRLLLRVSEDVDTWERPGELTWRPDGRELAFTSGHLPSFYARDIYAITSDGKSLRRITNPPLPEAIGAYPQGRVTFSSPLGESASGEYKLYMQGMREWISWTDPGRFETWHVPVQAADFGDQKQRTALRQIGSRTNSGTPYCAYNEPGTMVDVRACETVEVASRIPATGWTLNAVPCVYATAPLWTRDGRELLYLARHDTLDESYELVRTASEPTMPANSGRLVSPPQPLLAVPAEPLYYAALDPSDNAHMIVSVDQLGSHRIYRVSSSDPRQTVDITDLVCSRCQLAGLQYRKDGSGLYYVVQRTDCEPVDSSTWCWELRRYSFASGSTETLTKVRFDRVTGLTVSPDETRFLFSVPSESGGSNSLWQFDTRRAGDPRLFLENAADAAWSPAL